VTERIVVGSETQNFETTSVISGIQRVVREAHLGLTDRLALEGMDLVPFHTRDEPRRPTFRSHPYFALDPVLDQVPRTVEDVDVLCLLDLHGGADFSRIFRDVKRRPRPVIAVVYDITPILMPDAHPETAYFSFKVHLQQLLRLADHIVVTCEKVRSDLLSLGWRVHGQIHVIPLGSTFRPRRPEQPPDERLSMMYVSTIEPRKGHLTLVDAFDLLRREGLDVDLTLIGRGGWADPSVFARITEHPDFGGRLRWLESPDDNAIITTARRCSIGVFPSSDEGFGLFVEEGLALGLKMVVSDIEVFRERRQSNLFFHGPSAEELRDALIATHHTVWTPPARPVRLMADFVDNLADLVIEVAGKVQREQSSL